MRVVSIHGRFSFFEQAHGIQGALVDRGNVPPITIPPVAESVDVVFSDRAALENYNGRPLPVGRWVVMHGSLNCGGPNLTVVSWRYANPKHR